MTHRYAILGGGLVIPGRDGPDASAVAWAEDTIIALGSDDDVAGISRGDSHVVDLAGRCVVPLDAGGGASWPAEARIEVGGSANLAVLESDPRDAAAAPGRALRTVALIRSGRLVAGRLPGGLGGHPTDGHGGPPEGDRRTTSLTVDDHDVPVLRRLLGRSIAEDRGEIKRLRMLSTAYADRPAGQGRDPQIAQAEDTMRVAEDLLRQIG